MWTETHRCSVDGCPNLSAYEVVRYHFDLEEGAVLFEPDPDCPTLCVEHALDNERHANGERRPGATVRYPFTNREGRPGITLYRQPQPHYEEELPA